MKLSKLIVVAAFALVLSVTSIACNRAGSSPTATLKAYFEALQKKDAAALKKTLSKGTLEMFEKFAKLKSPPQTLDEALQTGLANMTNAGSDKMPDTRNEKIDGERATLEAKNEKTNSWETVIFVKEDGDWKIAFDEMLRGGSNTGTSSGNSTGNANK
ncbi:MAG: DUF4878 domain-containing protein [Pyrinomonadaceae bacterium]|nr:DUF4878 domain-containing protein [Pyrinomonadaceae bacterium]